MLTTLGQPMTFNKRVLKRKRENLIYDQKDLEKNRLSIKMSIESKESEIALDENNATLKAELGKFNSNWDEIRSKISSKQTEIDQGKSEYDKRVISSATKSSSKSNVVSPV